MARPRRWEAAGRAIRSSTNGSPSTVGGRWASHPLEGARASDGGWRIPRPYDPRTVGNRWLAAYHRVVRLYLAPTIRALWGIGGWPSERKRGDCGTGSEVLYWARDRFGERALG